MSLSCTVTHHPVCYVHPKRMDAPHLPCVSSYLVCTAVMILALMSCWLVNWPGVNTHVNRYHKHHMLEPHQELNSDVILVMIDKFVCSKHV